MNRSSSLFVWGSCGVALVIWGATVIFGATIDSQTADITAALAAGQVMTQQRSSATGAIALASATAGERGKLEDIVNRDILTLSNLIAEAGQDASVPLSIVNVTPGPGPSLPRGSALHPSSALFSVKASGSYAALMSAAALLESLPVASTLESLQLSRSETPGVWDLNATVGIVTGNSLGS